MLVCVAFNKQSFGHVFDMELACKLNFVGTKPMPGHMRKQETESERKREKKRECVYVGLFIDAVSV